MVKNSAAARDDFEAAIDDDVEQEAGAQPGKKGKKVTKKATNTKKGADAGECFVKKCFARGCTLKKKGNSKFCIPHDVLAAAMKYQAIHAVPTELASYNFVMDDPDTADEALEEFGRENLGRSRKKLIEWGRWKKRYGVRIVAAVTENEELMDRADFITLEKAKGVYDTTAKQKWTDLKDTKTDREGEGAALKIWVARNKTRTKTKETYEDGAYEEESKATKDPSADTKKEMLALASRNASSSSDFIREGSTWASQVAAGPSPQKTEVEGESSAKKAKTVDMVDAGSKAYQKHSKTLEPIMAKFVEAAATMKEQTAGITGGGIFEGDKLLPRYYQSACRRMQLLPMWSADATVPLTPVVLGSGLLPPADAEIVVPGAQPALTAAPGAGDGEHLLYFV